VSELEQEVVVDEEEIEVPSTLPVLPLKETVVFPQSMTPLAIGQERSIALVDEVASGDRMLALVAVRDEDVETPGWDDLHEIGTAAVVHKLIRIPDGTLRILVQGVKRIRLERRVQEEPYLVGEFADVPEVVEESKPVTIDNPYVPLKNAAPAEAKAPDRSASTSSTPEPLVITNPYVTPANNVVKSGT